MRESDAATRTSKTKREPISDCAVVPFEFARWNFYVLADCAMRWFLWIQIKEKLMSRQGVGKVISNRGERRQTRAGTGMVTRGSSGRPKASRPGAPRGHTTAKRTTSTNVPGDVPKAFLNKLG